MLMTELKTWAPACAGATGSGQLAGLTGLARLMGLTGLTELAAD